LIFGLAHQRSIDRDTSGRALAPVSLFVVFHTLDLLDQAKIALLAVRRPDIVWTSSLYFLQRSVIKVDLEERHQERSFRFARSEARARWCSEFFLSFRPEESLGRFLPYCLGESVGRNTVF
jgi:hypothetical protein